MKRLGMFLVFVCLIMTIGGDPVSAHPFSASYSTLTVSADSVEHQFSIDTLSVIESLAIEVDVNANGTLQEEEVQAGKAKIAEWMSRNVIFKLNGMAQQGNLIDMRMEEKGSKEVVTTRFMYKVSTAGKKLSLDDALYTDYSTSSYVHLLTVKQGDSINEVILKGGNHHWETTLSANIDNTSTSDSSSGPWSDAPQFLLLGMEHILTGYDHLLFLLALLLRKQTLKQYASIITAFTIAHSITLSLAMFELVRLPSQWVEVAIALSIAYVAAENVWRKNVSHRWLLTFAFGLIHGLGFASVLTEMSIPKNHLALSLVSFNLGIETVQLALVLIALPMLILWQKGRYFLPGLRFGSWAIIIMAVFWTLERLG